MLDLQGNHVAVHACRVVTHQMADAEDASNKTVHALKAVWKRKHQEAVRVFLLMNKMGRELVMAVTLYVVLNNKSGNTGGVVSLYSPVCIGRAWTGGESAKTPL